MKVWINQYEAYPVYSMSVKPDPNKTEAELTEEEFKQIEKAFAMMDEAQELLERKWKSR
jgi:Ca2+-binding EF-hand superfamily protein